MVYTEKFIIENVLNGKKTIRSKKSAITREITALRKHHNELDGILRNTPKNKIPYLLGVKISERDLIDIRESVFRLKKAYNNLTN